MTAEMVIGFLIGIPLGILIKGFSPNRKQLYLAWLAGKNNVQEEKYKGKF